VGPQAAITSNGPIDALFNPVKPPHRGQEQAQRVISAAAQPPQLREFELFLQAIFLQRLLLHRSTLSVAAA
jgi:hypothetical protein